MTEELGAISVGLKVGLGSLDADIARIQKKVKSVSREWPISFKVGAVNVTEVQREIKKITQGKISVTVQPTLSAGAGSRLKREIESALKSAGPVKVNVAAVISQTEINRIRKAIGDSVVGTGGARGGGGTPVAARAQPAGPAVASSFAANAATPRVGGVWTPAAMDAFWRRENAALDRAERKAMRERERQATQRAKEEQREKNRIARTYGVPVSAPPAARPAAGTGAIGFPTANLGITTRGCTASDCAR